VTVKEVIAVVLVFGVYHFHVAPVPSVPVALRTDEPPGHMLDGAAAGVGLPDIVLIVRFAPVLVAEVPVELVTTQEYVPASPDVIVFIDSVFVVVPI
jgi:hypothetical protein